MRIVVVLALFVFSAGLTNKHSRQCQLTRQLWKAKNRRRFWRVTATPLKKESPSSVQELVPMIVRSHLIKDVENDYRSDNRQYQAGRMK
jgi:hypothetical protein